MSQVTDPSALSLFPLHELPEPSLWPLSSGGYWLLAGVLLLTLALVWVGRWWHRRWQALAPYRQAKQALVDLRQLPADQALTVQALARWLRRVALVIAPRERVAPSHGEHWVAELVELAKQPALRQPCQALLAQQQFRPAAAFELREEELAACFSLAEALLQQLKRHCCEHA